jgi:hypothetical protein
MESDDITGAPGAGMWVYIDRETHAFVLRLKPFRERRGSRLTE